jgi:xeroderma pigmentosum group C-complementing protein
MYTQNANPLHCTHHWQARLLSLTPLALQNAFAVIHKSRVADANQRGRLFESAIERLTEWWCNSFFSVEPVGHIRSRTFSEIQKMVAHLPPLGEQDTLNVEALEDEEECEVLHTSKSLMKHALMRGGSRDVSAQLFTSLCRALGIPARLVVSLQSVPWQAGVGKPKPKSSGKKKDVKGKGKEKALDDEDDEEDEEDNEMEEIDIPSTSIDIKGKGKANNGTFMTEGRRLDGQSVSSGIQGKEKAKPVIRLRKQKSKGNVLGSSSSPAPRRESMSFLDPKLFSSHADPCRDTGSNNHAASILDRSFLPRGCSLATRRPNTLYCQQAQNV